MARTGGIKGYLDDFKKSKLAIPFSLVLAGLIAYILLIVGSVLFCLLPAAIALVIFGLPRYFGLVNRKKLLIYGTILILLLGVVSGLTYYSILKDNVPVTLSTTDNVLTSGSLTPFRGTDTTTFRFSVIYNGTDINPYVNVTVYDYFQAGEGTTYNLTHDLSYTGTLGERYVLNRTFQTSIYDFGFSYDKPDGTKVTTDLSWGPYTMTNDDILVNELWKVPLTMFLNVGLLFYLLILLTWWMERSKKRFESQGGRSTGRAAPKTTEKFVCSECGSEVPATADKCPQCGEKFEEDSQSTLPTSTTSTEPKSNEYICSDCGKTVKETDTQCWNCGKKFED
jgi:DNA-directed RNA polymerase subunit RPC12/RpoP